MMNLIPLQTVYPPAETEKINLKKLHSFIHANSKRHHGNWNFKNAVNINLTTLNVTLNLMYITDKKKQDKLWRNSYFNRNTSKV